MPELPEVETVRRGIEQHCLHKTIATARILSPRTARNQSGGESAWARALESQQFSAAVRRGKFLWLELAGQNQAVIFHLGMSGQLRVRDAAAAQAPPSKHLRARLNFTDGSCLDFVDQRIFGHTEVRQLLPTTDSHPGGYGSPALLLPAGVEHIARDVLDPYLDVEGVIRKARQSSRCVKTILLDQGLVSGIGNIYADEGLYLAGVSPLRAGNRLAVERWRRLLEAVGEVMRFALQQGGTSFDALYVNTTGEPGYFARQLRVYGRDGETCRNCGSLVIRTVVGGRSSHWCRTCQR